MYLLKRYVVLALMCVLSAPNGLCWGPEGHRIVAAIAFKQLNKSIKDAIEDLLGDEDFVQAANWADNVRFSRPETKDWHFIDIPVSAAKYDAVRDCEELETGDCAVQELARATLLLRDRTKPAKARREALKFIIHFVGDIHQPLHSATNDTRASGDRGGNSVNTRLLTHTMKLHAVWDHGLLELDDRDEGEYADGLIKDLVKKGKTSDSGTVEDWVNESHQLAVSVAYKYPGFKVGKVPSVKVALSQAYADKGKPVVDLQLARAGVRLARVIR